MQREKIRNASMTEEQINERNKTRREAYRRKKADAANKENTTGGYIFFFGTLHWIYSVFLNITYCSFIFITPPVAVVEHPPSEDVCISGTCMEQTQTTISCVQASFASGQCRKYKLFVPWNLCTSITPLWSTSNQLEFVYIHSAFVEHI
jgi:hypothetical protein